MPDTPEIIAAKLEALRAVQNPRVAELVLIAWPDPDGRIYYASRIAQDILDSESLLDQLDGSVEFRLPGNAFLDIEHDSGIADDRVDLDFWDGDDEMSRLANEHGEGVKVEIFYWFPEVELLYSQWWGHLRPPDDADVERFKASAQSGFRSANLPMPRRAFFTGCQAMFGGLLETQAEIDQGDCPYSRHLAGEPTSRFGSDETWLQTLAPGDGWQNPLFDDSSWDTAVSLGVRNTFPWNFGGGVNLPPFPASTPAEWIWWQAYVAPGDLSTVYFRKSFVAAAADALLVVAGDNVFTAYLDGQQIAAGSDWTQSHAVNLTLVPAQTYVLAFKVDNVSATGFANPGGLLCEVAYGISGIGFGNLDPETSEPYKTCPRNNFAACIARLEPEGATRALSYLAFDTISASHVVHQTKGPNITVTSRGNETNLKRPLRVIAGKRHVSAMDLLTYVVEPNTNHPEQGSVKCLFAACEGPIRSMTNGKINGNTIGFQHLNVRLGELRQVATSFSPTIHNYPGTGLFLGVSQGDFREATADNLQGEADVEGLRNVRVYTSETAYTEEYTAERGWWLLRALADKRWGYGLDYVRFILSEWVELAIWCRENVSFTDKDGNIFNGQRTTFNAELIDRSAQQQITDICLAGRFSLPFPDGGKIRVVPLRRAKELFSIAVFTNHGFKGCLDRAPDAGEEDAWSAALQAAREISNTALLEAARELLTELFEGEEYDDLDTTNDDFVEDLYLAYLDRPADPAGKAFWVNDAVVNGRNHTIEAFGLAGEFIDRTQDKPVPTFTDIGPERNICVDEDGKSSLRWSVLSDAELPNRIVITLDDEEHLNNERPLTFEDELQQLRAGRAFGDTTRRVVERNYSAFGVTNVGEASRLGNLLLHLGEFDEGGPQNNFRPTFVTWWTEAIEVKKYGIIRVKSTAKFARYGFEYFRVRTIKRMADLKVEISCQAYPVDYYDQLELWTVPPPVPGTGIEDPPGGPPGGRPTPIGFDELDHSDDRIHFRLAPL